ncbi:MAG: hypothetical protein KKH52_00820 [Nanoarchaeota archaeon]|nr:hypothetical protein [Nanoarchaeota archaeon]
MSGIWSACNDDAVKTRTAYQCSEQTNFECQSFEEEVQCKTEVTAKGRVTDSQLRIYPTIEKNVKGIINVEYLNVPEDTEAVIFIIQSGKIDMEQGVGQNTPIDSDGSDGWNIMYDTTEYNNGLYTIAAVAGKGFGDNQPPLDAASAQVIIKN